MLSREEMIERLKKAETDKVYFVYNDNNFEEMTDEKLETTYINMQNYLSDARTHTDY